MSEQNENGELRKQTNSRPSFDFAIDNIRFSLILNLITNLKLSRIIIYFGITGTAVYQLRW